MNLKKIHLILFLKPYYNWNAFNTVLTAKEIVNI